MSAFAVTTAPFPYSIVKTVGPGSPFRTTIRRGEPAGGSALRERFRTSTSDHGRTFSTWAFRISSVEGSDACAAAGTEGREDQQEEEDAAPDAHHRIRLLMVWSISSEAVTAFELIS